MAFPSFTISLIFVTNSIFGIVRHRDCSTASRAIFCNLSDFFSFHCLMIDLSLGQKKIASNQISVNFWTINSTFSRLFGMAIIIHFFVCAPLRKGVAEGRGICSLIPRISPVKVLSVRSLISTSYLFVVSCSLLVVHCTKMESPLCNLKTFLT